MEGTFSSSITVRIAAEAPSKEAGRLFANATCRASASASTLSLSPIMISTRRTIGGDSTLPSSLAPVGWVPGVTALAGSPSSFANACAAARSG